MGWKFPLGESNPYPEVVVDLAAGVLTDTNSVIASGSMGSGSFTTAAVASDTDSTGGDPARLVWPVTVDLTGIGSISVKLNGVSYAAATGFGLVVQVVDTSDPSTGKGIAWTWGTVTSTQRCAARAAFGTPSFTNQGLTTPTAMRGSTEFQLDGAGTVVQICNPWASLQDVDGKTGNESRAASTAINDLSATTGFELVLAVRQPATATAFTYTGLSYQLHPRLT